MAREGTRSATGHSTPRIFAVPEAPTKPRKTGKVGRPAKPKANTSATRAAAPKKVGRPAGVTKKKAPVKKTTVADKVKGAVKKAEGAVTKNPQKKAAGTKKMNGTDGTKATKATTKAKKV